MTTTLTREDNILVAHLCGELDHCSASEVREILDSALESDMPDRLIFDLSKVTFMDSSGIGVVMGRYRQMVARGGGVSFRGVNSRIDKLIAVSGLLKIIPVDTLDMSVSASDEKRKCYGQGD